jgi:long-chain fatty acid transport protein
MKKFLIAVFCLCFASQLLAITDEEIFRSFSLNLNSPGARARGMGGAFIGRADDATATVTNPAGLTILVKPEVALEYGHKNSQTTKQTVVGIPVAAGYDVTPSPVDVPHPGVLDEPFTAEFQSSDNLDTVNQLDFFSVVYPFGAASVAFSRFELIDTNATVSGEISSSPFHYVERNAFFGSVDISSVEYLFTASVKAGSKFSLGGSLIISDLGFESDIGAVQKGETELGDHFRSTIDTDDTKVGANVGVLIRPSSKVGIGAVYHYEPEFDLDVNVINADFTPDPRITSKSGFTTVKFDIPDSVGVGISIEPAPNFIVDLDVIYIWYSQLESVVTGYSLFTHLLPKTKIDCSAADIANGICFLPADQIDFAIDNKTDVHIGAEYLWITGSNVVAFRGGYYRQGRNRFFLESAANPEVQSFLEPIFGNDPGNGINHYTIGSGITHGNYSLDAALDFNQKVEVDELNNQEITDGGWAFLLSGVVRF